jgi:hypothetical protein
LLLVFKFNYSLRAAFFVSRVRKRKREAEAEEIRLARSSSGTSIDSKSFRRRPDDSAEQVGALLMSCTADLPGRC